MSPLDVTLERDNLAKWSFPSHSRCCPKYRRRKAATVTMATTNSSPVLTRNWRWIRIFNVHALPPLWSLFSALIYAKKIKQTNFFSPSRAISSTVTPKYFPPPSKKKSAVPQKSLWLCIFEFLREKTGLTNSSGSPKRDSFSVSSLPLCQQKGKKTFLRLGSTPLARANAVERKRKKTSSLRRIFPSSGPEIAERRLRKFLSYAVFLLHPSFCATAHRHFPPFPLLLHKKHRSLFVTSFPSPTFHFLPDCLP